MPETDASPSRARIDSVDLVRGFVMIVMLLDHMRDFLHRDGLTADPLDAATTTPQLYLTRWITHLCAPTFVFLAGLSVQLQLRRGTAVRDVSRRLASRGLFLVALELVVLRPLIWFHFDYTFAAHLQVIWVIGWSMVVLALLIHAPLPVILAFGLAQIVFHDLLDGIRVAWPAESPGEIAWVLAHQRSAIRLGGEGGPIVFAQYPLVPWIGVMATGFVAGQLWSWPAPARRRVLTVLGAGALAVFALLRGLNLYGDPRPWRAPADPGGAPLASWRTLAAVFDVEKYPPSLAFLAVTLGIALLLLAIFDGQSRGRLGRRIVVFGRVPLFFYVLQWPFVHFVAWLLQWLDGQPVGWDMQFALDPHVPAGAGFDLPGVFLGWAIGLLVLYPLCIAFAAFERRRRAARQASA